MNRSEQLFAQAKQYIPGGVNSPVRAFGSIGGSPKFIASADRATMTDVDGKTYIDYVCSWGPMILGHNHPAIREAVVDAASRGLSYGATTEAELEMARLICEMVPSFDMVRMVNSGTEAVMSAIRVARGYTGKSKVIKCNGCYHGHSDGMLIKAGSGVMTAGVPDSAGVPVGCTQDTLSAEYNDLDSVRQLFITNPDQIAAIIVEPVAANMGVVPAQEGFLQGLRDICDANHALLIFDEVITGFRLSEAGAQGYYGITPDLSTFGKIIGAGMPVGCYGGRREIMQVVAPVGAVYQAGTLSGNPVAMAAGMAQLRMLHDHPEWYAQLNAKSDAFYGEIRSMLQKHGCGYTFHQVGSLGCLFFTEQPVFDYTSAKTADTQKFGEYARYLFENGIYCAPSQFEAMFLSMAHTDAQLEQTLHIMEGYFR